MGEEPHLLTWVGEVVDQKERLALEVEDAWRPAPRVVGLLSSEGEEVGVWGYLQRLLG